MAKSPDTAETGTPDGTLVTLSAAAHFAESFESAPGTTYTLSATFDDGDFDFFDRYAVPDNGNAARDDFQVGWDGSFGIIGQDHDGEGGDATRSIFIDGIDITGFADPAVSILLGALDSEPAFENYEAADGDGISILATINGGTQTLIGAFAPDDAAGDLREDTDLDGVGDGATLTTTLREFAFELPSTGTTLDLEIRLTSTAGFEPLAVDRVVVDEASEVVPLANLVVTEIMQNPSAVSDTDGEYFEIFNAGDSAVDLQGFTFSDLGSDSFTVGTSTVVAPGDYFVLARNGDTATNGGFVADFVYTGFTLANGDDEIVITDPLDREVDRVAYDGGPDFPDPTGASMELVDEELDNNVGANWTTSTETFGDGDFGTPGEDNGLGFTEATIAEIQGGGHLSPFVATGSVADFVAANPDGATGGAVRTTGIVTATTLDGFFIQDAPDGDDDTSDAIFVVSTNSVTIGDEVSVDGIVEEVVDRFRELPQTVLNASSVNILTSGNALPEAVDISGIIPDAVFDDDGFTSFDRTSDGLDFFEAIEGMRVTVSGTAVAGTNRFQEIFLVGEGNTEAGEFSDSGTLNIAPGDFNPEKIQISEEWNFGGGTGFGTPQIDTGSSVEATGVITYDFGNYQVLPTATVATSPGDLMPEETDLAGRANKLSIATYNVLNLDPVVEDPSRTEDGIDDQDDDVGNGRFAAIAEQIVGALNSPDIIALQEVQDNTGAEINDGVTSASDTLQQLIDAIDMADDGVDNSSTPYAFIDNTFILEGESGGQPGGNIRTAFLYNTERVDLVDGSVQPVGSQAPGETFEGARLPLSATFLFNGEEVTVVNNHFSSKGGSAPIAGVEQPFEDLQEDPGVNGSLNERREQAQAVNDFVDGILAGDPEANVVVLGDLNEFEFVSPLDILAGTTLSTNDGFDTAPGGTAVLDNLIDTLPEEERFSFIFQGNSQTLDHVLATQNLSPEALVDIVHVNSEFAATDQRASDHDPIVALFDFLDVEVTAQVGFALRSEDADTSRAKGYIDGEVVDRDFLSFEDEVTFAGTGITVRADAPGDPDELSFADGLLGVRASDDDPASDEAGTLEGDEALILDLTAATGEAVNGILGVGSVSGSGEVEIEMSRDGSVVRTFVADAGAGDITFDARGDTFDVVTVRALDDTAVAFTESFLNLTDDLSIV